MARRAIKAGKAEVEIGIRNRIAAGAKAVQADLRKLSSKLSGIGQSTMKVGAIMATSVAAPLTIAIKLGSEMQETLGKFNTVFGSSAGKVRDWGETTADAMGVSEQSMLSMLSGMQDLLVPMGMLPKSAYNASKTLSQLAIDLGSFNNMNPEQVFNDLQSAMTGSGEVMKKYGVILSQTAVNQELHNKGINPKNATEAQKAQARMNIIMRGTTAAQGDAIRTSGSFANQIKRMKSNVTDLATAFGSELLEELAEFAGLINGALGSVKKFVKENSDLVKVFATALVAIGGIGAGLVTVGGLLSLAGFAVAGFATALGVLFSPLGLAIGGIAALGLALRKYTNIGGGAIEALRARFGPLVEDVGKAVSAIVAALKAGDMEKAWELTSDLIEMVWLDMTEEIRSAWLSMMKFILSTGDSIAIGIGKIFQGLATVLEGMMATYKTIYDGIYDSVLELGGDLTGVATIGETSSGFDASFGNVAAGAQAGIDSLNDFGVAMEEEAEGRRDERAKEKDAKAEERKQRRDELGEQFTAEFKAAEEARRKRDDDDGGNGGDTNISVRGGELPSPAEAKRAGASGTFSAFGAAIMGMAPVLQKVSDPALLEEQKKQNVHLERIEKNIKPLNGFQ